MEERSLLSMSPDPLVVIHGGNWSEFIKKLRGVLGADLKLQESKAFCLKNSIDSLNGVLQNPRRNFRKKRSPRFDASLLDDDPSTSEVLSAALTLQLLREDNSFSPHFSGTGESKIGSEKRRKGCPVEDTEGNMSAVKKARRSLIPVLENLSPELPVNFKNRIRELTGSAEVGVVFVHEKTLFRTDVNPGQNRFLIPVKQVKNDFLTEKEKETLRTSDEISGKGSIEALLIQPSLDNSYDMIFVPCNPKVPDQIQPAPTPKVSRVKLSIFVVAEDRIVSPKSKAEVNDLILPNAKKS